MGDKYAVPPRYEEVWEVMKGYGRREFTVNEVMDAGFRMSHVSNALKVLRNLGYVEKVRKGHDGIRRSGWSRTWKVKV